MTWQEATAAIAARIKEIGRKHQALTHYTLNPAQAAVYEPNAAFFDTLVELELVREE